MTDAAPQSGPWALGGAIITWSLLFLREGGGQHWNVGGALILSKHWRGHLGGPAGSGGVSVPSTWAVGTIWR